MPPGSAVSVTLSGPSHMVVGPLGLIVATGFGLIATFALPVEEQPLFVTVAVRATVPDAPAVNWIAFVPAPEVIVPFVMLQL